MRTMDLYKPPGVAETLDWTEALVALGARELDEQLVEATLGSVLKYREDQQRAANAGLAALVRGLGRDAGGRDKAPADARCGGRLRARAEGGRLARRDRPPRRVRPRNRGDGPLAPRRRVMVGQDHVDLPSRGHRGLRPRLRVVLGDRRRCEAEAAAEGPSLRTAARPLRHAAQEDRGEERDWPGGRQAPLQPGRGAASQRLRPVLARGVRRVAAPAGRPQALGGAQKEPAPGTRSPRTPRPSPHAARRDADRW